MFFLILFPVRAIPELTLNDGTALPAVGLGTCRLTGRPAPRRWAARSPGYRLLCSAFNYEYVPLSAAVTVGKPHTRSDHR